VPDKDSAKDSGTESAEASVEPDAQTVEQTEAETPSEDTGMTDAPAAEAPFDEPPAEAPAPASEPKRSRRRLPRALRHKHAKPARGGSSKRKPITRTPKPEREPGARQERRGVVVSDKGDKTIVVKVDVTKLHPQYKKVVRRSRKFHAHDEENAAGIGDVVRIVESRPLSKTKHWRLSEIVEKAK
jgi:small subunit ribosomal protein S17